MHPRKLLVSCLHNPATKASPSDASNEGHWPEAAETSNSSIEPYMGCLLQLVPEAEMAHHRNAASESRLAGKVVSYLPQKGHMGQAMKLGLSCYLVLLSIDSKTR